MPELPEVETERGRLAARIEGKRIVSARIDDALVVNTTYDSFRGPRLFITQRITRDGALIAEAVVEAACISLGGRPRKPPPGLVERLKPWFEA